MKKSLIALAVAGAFAAPAFAASSNVDIYGKLRMSVDYVDSDNNSDGVWKINDQTSRVGIKGSEDLGGGMKAVWQVEQALKAVDSLTVDAGGSTDTGGAFGGAGLRNTFIGLSGGFGTVIVGRHDTPYKLGGSADVFVDTAADAQKSSGIIGSGNFDARVSGTIAYISPEWNGFHFAAATVPGEQTTAAGTATPAANGLFDAYSLVGVYKNGPLNASLAYENHDNVVDESAWKVNVGYKFGDLAVGATYEDQSRAALVGGVSDDRTAWLVSAAYGMGPISLLAQYGDRSSDVNANDLTRWTLGVGYALSKRTNTYVAYNDDDANGKKTTTWTFGVNHDF